jgi:hypothetical protein
VKAAWRHEAEELRRRKAIVFKQPQDNPLLRAKPGEQVNQKIASASMDAEAQGSGQGPAATGNQPGATGSSSGSQVAPLKLTPKSQVDLLRSNTAFLSKVQRSFEGSASCKKAITMVSKYAFSDIQILSCKGRVYHFSGLRKGKLYSIKVNPTSWELTEVARLLPSASLLQPGTLEWQ